MTDPLLILENTFRARADAEIDAHGFTYKWSELSRMLWRVKIMRLFGQNQEGPKGRLP